MASTGFWPVKSRLKEVIDYAENPDKTTDRQFLDEDLWAALRYEENDKKTDQTMYITGINCPKQRAYRCMMATKRRFGKLGGNVAYHGYQSFASGEVTPEEAHKIGATESSAAMWLTTGIRALRPARSRQRKRTKSVWKPHGGCGAATTRSSLPLT